VDEVTFRMQAAKKEQAKTISQLRASAIVKMADEVEVRTYVRTYVHMTLYICTHSHTGFPASDCGHVVCTDQVQMYVRMYVCASVCNSYITITSSIKQFVLRMYSIYVHMSLYFFYYKMK
jgi:hypothetical protein